MYTVEEDLNCYTVRDGEGTYSSLVATCSNEADARRIARALNLEAAIGEVREAAGKLNFESVIADMYASHAEWCFKKCDCENEREAMAQLAQALSALDAAEVSNAQG